jgi:hypothetical protein
VKPLAKLIGSVILLGAAPAGENHAACGHAGESGEPDQLPAHPHRSLSVAIQKFGGTESGHWWMLSKDAVADA